MLIKILDLIKDIVIKVSNLFKKEVAAEEAVVNGGTGEVENAKVSKYWYALGILVVLIPWIISALQIGFLPLTMWIIFSLGVSFYFFSTLITLLELTVKLF